MYVNLSSGNLIAALCSRSNLCQGTHTEQANTGCFATLDPPRPLHLEPNHRHPTRPSARHLLESRQRKQDILKRIQREFLGRCADEFRWRREQAGVEGEAEVGLGFGRWWGVRAGLPAVGLGSQHGIVVNTQRRLTRKRPRGYVDLSGLLRRWITGSVCRGSIQARDLPSGDMLVKGLDTPALLYRLQYPVVVVLAMGSVGPSIAHQSTAALGDTIPVLTLSKSHARQPLPNDPISSTLPAGQWSSRYSTAHPTPRTQPIHDHCRPTPPAYPADPSTAASPSVARARIPPAPQCSDGYSRGAIPSAPARSTRPRGLSSVRAYGDVRAGIRPRRR